MIRKPSKRRLLVAAALAGVALLAACGSGSDDHASGPTPGNPGTITPPVILDAFLDAVRLTLLSSPEDTEAASIDGITATTPEDNEPAAL